MFTRDRMFILPALTAEALSRQSKRRIRRLPRANAGPPARAREDSPRAGRATGTACVDATRV
jgi:hypothetical protein